MFVDLTPFTALLLVLLATLNYITIILELVIELRIQRPWNDDLEEEKSDAYKELSLLLKTEVISRNDPHQDICITTVTIVPFSCIFYFYLYLHTLMFRYTFKLKK